MQLVFFHVVYHLLGQLLCGGETVGLRISSIGVTQLSVAAQRIVFFLVKVV